MDFRQLFTCFLEIMLGSFILMSIVYIAFPQSRVLYIGEDMLIENTGALFFLTTFLLGLLFLPNQKGEKGFKALIIITLFGLIGFLEEISYGERIFNLNMPHYFGVKFDAIHDLFHVASMELYELLGNSKIILISIFITVLIVLSLALLKYKNRLLQHPYFLFLFLSFVLGFVASIIDLVLFDKKWLFLFEELLEMNAALALVFAVLSIFALDSEKIE